VIAADIVCNMKRLALHDFYLDLVQVYTGKGFNAIKLINRRGNDVFVFYAKKLVPAELPDYIREQIPDDPAHTAQKQKRPEKPPWTKPMPKKFKSAAVFKPMKITLQN